MKKTSLGLGTFIGAQRSALPWPLCQTCGRPCDSETLVEGRPGETDYARVLVKHHGSEELRTLHFGTRVWDFVTMGKYVQAAHWFDPTLDSGEVKVMGARQS